MCEKLFSIYGNSDLDLCPFELKSCRMVKVEVLDGLKLDTMWKIYFIFIVTVT